MTELNLISRLLIASLVDEEENGPVLPSAFYLVINNRVDTRKTALSLTNTAFSNDALGADIVCGNTA